MVNMEPVRGETVITVVFGVHGGEPLELRLNAEEGSILSGYEIRVNGDPIVGMPFAIHDDSRRYHTVCARRNPSITEVDV